MTASFQAIEESGTSADVVIGVGTMIVEVQAKDTPVRAVIPVTTTERKRKQVWP